MKGEVEWERKRFGIKEHFRIISKQINHILPLKLINAGLRPIRAFIISIYQVLRLSGSFSEESLKMHRQPSRGVFSKMVPENIQQIHRKNPCRSVISIKMLWNFIALILWHGCSFFCKFAAYFQNTFFKKHLWMAPPENVNIQKKWALIQKFLTSINGARGH